MRKGLKARKTIAQGTRERCRNHFPPSMESMSVVDVLNGLGKGFMTRSYA